MQLEFQIPLEEKPCLVRFLWGARRPRPWDPNDTGQVGRERRRTCPQLHLALSFYSVTAHSRLGIWVSLTAERLTALSSVSHGDHLSCQPPLLPSSDLYSPLNFACPSQCPLCTNPDRASPAPWRIVSDPRLLSFPSHPASWHWVAAACCLKGWTAAGLSN